MHMAAGAGDFLLIGFEIEVEMGERMVLDVLGLLAERIELRQRCARQPRGAMKLVRTWPSAR